MTENQSTNTKATLEQRGENKQKQLTLFVTFHVKPDAANISAFKEAHRPVWAACASEPQCLLFDVFQDPDRPGVFRFIEVWSEGREWFETQQLTKPYYTTLWERSRPTWVEGTDVLIEYFEREGEGCAFRKGYLDGGRLMG